MAKFRPFLLLAGLLVLGFPSQARGQAILVQVVEEETQEPISLAFLALVNAEGVTVKRALTDASGRHLFVSGEAGTYRVRAEMFGRKTLWSPPMTVQPDENVSHRFRLPQEAIDLPGIRVETTRQCQMRPEDGLALARVWEEAQKALVIQEWMDQERLFRFQITSFERYLDPEAETVRSETRDETVSMDQNPIRSLPADQLAEGGFIRQRDDGDWVYFGPDASVLLSDPFLESHCFLLREDEDRPERIGLAFEPSREEEHPDIRGTLWLDRQTAHLEFLEWEYTDAPSPLDEGQATGRADFRRLPNGAWVVQRWWIRMPTLGKGRLPWQWEVTGIKEQGGELADASPATERRLAARPAGWLEGVVWDSTLARPLPDARLVLFGTDWDAMSDTLGRFRFEDLPEGQYTLGFSHPRLDSIGAFPGGTQVEIRRGEGSEAFLATPSAETILASRCFFRGQPAGTAAIAGRVRNLNTGQPVPRAAVTVQWETRPQEDERSLRRGRARAVTDAAGLYYVCGAPTDRPITVRADFLDHPGTSETLQLSVGSYGAVELAVDLPPGFIVYQDGATLLEEGSGMQGVQGWLREPDSGAPIRGADVVLRQTPGTIVVRGTTSPRGFFRLQTPLPGSYTLEVEAFGYAEIPPQSFTVTEGRLNVVEIDVAPAPLELEPVVVVGESRAFQLEAQGFYDRKEAGFGYFITPDDLSGFITNDYRQLLRPLPGLKFVQDMGGPVRLTVNVPSVLDGASCPPILFLDGALTGSTDREMGLAIGEVVSPEEVDAVEWYPRPSTAPPVWQATGSRCGILVVWTKIG